MADTRFNINSNEYLPLRDVVFNTLRDAILTGKLVPGERLMENQLAEKLGVSRTPVREALRMLELENLVELVPRKGAQVLDMSEVRGVLEGLATGLACKKMGAEGLAELKSLEERFEKAISEKALEEIAEIDEQFHNVIFASTDNDKLIQIFNNLQIQLYRYRMAHLKLDSSIPAIVAHHKGIIRAIENHDVEEGTTMAQGHVKYHTEFILRAVRNKETK